jgi:hypothetical protein
MVRCPAPEDDMPRGRHLKGNELKHTTKIAATAGVLLSFAAFTTFGTLSLFTDSQSVNGNSFSTGTVDISTSPSTALVSFSNMAPGDSVTNDVVVTNGGSLELRYSVSAEATDDDELGLKNQLVLTIRTGDVEAPAECTALDGSVLYTGDLDSTNGLLLGDASTGQDTGDRTLAASASESLCFTVSLPGATGNEFQGAATTATFTFAAEQTKNN